jgi:hypothetical protein
MADEQMRELANREYSDPDPGDAGISVTSVIVMLALLAVLVVGIFWALPAWFDGRVIDITIRN